MHLTSRILVPSTITVAGIGALLSALNGAPWWLTAAACGCFTLALLVAAIQSVFPQESADRLAWWREYLRHQGRG